MGGVAGCVGCGGGVAVDHDSGKNNWMMGFWVVWRNVGDFLFLEDVGL